MLEIHATKLHRPRPRADWIGRDRLLAVLDRGLAAGRGLILVSAPAGAGKTTLLGHWLANRPFRAAWLSLDPEDDEPNRFWLCVLMALQSAAPGLGHDPLDALRGDAPPPLAAVLPALLNEVGRFSEPLILVLDDYHVLASQAIHDSIITVVDHLPEPLHLVLCTRADPPLPLARWRSRGALIEVRGADLRFTPSEALAFLNQRMTLNLGAEDAALLVERTEGWAAGLQMAGLSLQGVAEPQAAIHAFTGSQHYVLEYLLDEVLARQPAPIQDFLTRTAILDRLCGSLCDAVLANAPGDSGHAGGAGTLASLQRQNLFVVPLDEQRTWYRYHHLFADLLRARLQQTAPGEIPALHLRASAWFAADGDTTQAVTHAVAANDWDRAAQLIDAGEHQWWDGSDMGFMRLLQRLPDEVIQRGPGLALSQSWFLLITGQLARLKAALDRLEPAVLRSESAQLRSLHDFITMQRAYSAEMLGEPGDKVVNLALLESVPEVRVGMRNSAEVILAYILYRNAAFPAAARLLEATIARDVATGGTSGIPIALTRLSRLYLAEGRLPELAELCRRYLVLVDERGRWRHYVAGNLNLVLGDVLRQWNRLAEAEACIVAGIADNEPWGIAHADALGRTALARLRLAQGDLGGAATALADLSRRTGARNLPPDQLADIRDAQVRCWLAANDTEAVRGWTADWAHLAAGELDFRGERDALTLARAWLALGETGRAAGLLPRVVAAAAPRPLRQAEALLLLADAAQAAGQPGDALAALSQSVALAASSGCLRLYLDEGPPARALLAALLRSGRLAPPAAAFARQVLAATPPAAAAAGEAALVEPLTPREQEVLDLLAAGHSNQEIADHLVITVHAVKKHAGNIYGKLGVTSRTQAIRRAAELGLLATR